MVETGRQFLTSNLPPELYIGTTPAFLRQEGNLPLITDSLKSLAYIGDIRSATNLNAIGGTSLNLDLFGSTESIKFLPLQNQMKNEQKYQ